ncbi:hypothetical protein BAU15_10165 [Enterococcus sp. JM4C]|uniref:DUF1048 domain-containing protein n=1 Tax=Candidatus Enterococcus huntleyi TaxID=1857217 RepID=UPI00137A8624|nr:DUF1048 domain-containing protein [Enterococcus sp. JM4C]KAF1296144.1 hypothetical protein BAU15_10165 [Enterococcus sp. JM4C]
MNFYDKVTGNDMNKKQAEFQKRIEKLPQDYQDSWLLINQKIWKYSDFTGRNLYPMLEGILGLYEESAAQGIEVNQVVGEPLDAFIAEIATIEGALSHRDKLRQQLNKNIAKKLGR